MSAAAKSQQKITVTLTRAQATQLANAADMRLLGHVVPAGPDRTALLNAYEVIDRALRGPCRTVQS